LERHFYADAIKRIERESPLPRKPECGHAQCGGMGGARPLAAWPRDILSRMCFGCEMFWCQVLDENSPVQIILAFSGFMFLHTCHYQVLQSGLGV